MRKTFLIVGGSSGLGLELATMYQRLGHTVHVTGRHDPALPNITFHKLLMGASTEQLRKDVKRIVASVEKVNTLVYTAGFYQEGHIDELSDEQIVTMANVGLLAPALFVNALKNNPASPLKVMLITSSSGYTPRELEPVYSAVKAGLGMLGESLALDKALGKIFVVAPSGMKTSFWREEERDVSEYLDPAWVAEQIADLSGGPFKYRFVKLLRGPARAEIVETRES